MFKAILRGLLGGTVGMLIIGIFSGQWFMGTVIPYTVGILSSIARYKKNNNQKINGRSRAVNGQK